MWTKVAGAVLKTIGGQIGAFAQPDPWTQGGATSWTGAAPGQKDEGLPKGLLGKGDAGQSPFSKGASAEKLKGFRNAAVLGSIG